MIVGSGVIGSSFGNLYRADPKICLYAAGVSNSQSVDNAEFIRDKNFLEENISKLKKNELLVYISTCSASTSNFGLSSRYVDHKIQMENIVINYSKYLILRLPQIASFSKNPFTLLNYFKNKIINEEPFKLLKNGYRNILDVQHMASIADKVITNFSDNKIINIANPISIPVIQIVEEMQNVFGKNAIYTTIDGFGDDYKIDVTEMLRFINPDIYHFDDKYLHRIILKYYQ